MGKALASNTILTVQSLDSNKVSDESAKALGKALESNTILTVLSLDGNKVSDEGAKAFGQENDKELDFEPEVLRASSCLVVSTCRVWISTRSF